MFRSDDSDNSRRRGNHGFLRLALMPGRCLARTQAEMRVAYVTPFTGSCRACFQEWLPHTTCMLCKILQWTMRLHFIEHFLSSKRKRLCNL